MTETRNSPEKMPFSTGMRSINPFSHLIPEYSRKRDLIKAQEFNFIIL